MKKSFESLVIANPDVVKRWVDHLLAAYEDFVDKEQAAGGDVKFADGLMAVHNLHASIIFHMEEEAGFDDEAIRFFRKTAVDTFVNRMRKGRGEG